MEPVKGKKLTKEIVNERLLKDGRDVQMIGDYINSKTKTLFKCSREHQWKTSYSSVQQGHNCPICHVMSVTLSKEQINERLKKDDRNIQMIGEYINSHTKSLFRCDIGHQWMARYGNICSGDGCPTCANRPYLTKSVINDRLKKDERDIRLIGDHINIHTQSLFECNKGHRWMDKYSNICRGSGCSICHGCSTHGFTGDKPAWRYVLVFKESKTPFIKFGITNRLDQRLYTHRQHNGEFEIAWTHHDENGHDTLAWENQIKKTFGGRYVSKDECPDGFTETLPLSMLNEIIRK